MWNGLLGMIQHSDVIAELEEEFKEELERFGVTANEIVTDYWTILKEENGTRIPRLINVPNLGVFRLDIHRMVKDYLFTKNRRMESKLLKELLRYRIPVKSEDLISHSTLKKNNVSRTTEPQIPTIREEDITTTSISSEIQSESDNS